MKKALGKWLMDLAKFVITAFVISGLLGGIENPAVAILVGVSTTAACLAAGLALMDENDEKKNKKGGRKKKSVKR